MNFGRNLKKCFDRFTKPHKSKIRFLTTKKTGLDGNATLLLKDSVRSTIAIRAFNVEISRIPYITSDDKIAAMRLKFWDDAIEKIFDKNNVQVPDHPVVNELNHICKSHKMTKQFFKRLISCRNRPRNQGFLTLKQIEEYAENSVSSVYYLSLEAKGINNVHVDHACSHLGKSQGIVNLLRSIPQLTREQAIPISQDILIKHGVSQERILRNKKDDKGVEECVFEIATLAHQHLEKARALLKSLPRDTKPFLLPGVAVQRYLERLRLVKFDLTHQKLLQRDNTLPIAYYWNYFRGTF
uniref:CSON000477 protein n=1 Tax=Culicoides sonorensis TaxID=179676 RepID=A0A336LTU3_CULSO